MQRELCQRITEVLASMPIQDPWGYEALASLKLPGMDYLNVLALLHKALRPKLYVEIGVRHGNSLFLADESTKCIAIDPQPRLAELRTNVELSVTTSDKFFYRTERAEMARGFDLALIDGDHSFEQAARDFANLERLAGPQSIIAIHDVIPMDERTATPVAQTSFHTGDVWRLVRSLVTYRQDLTVVTIACPPTGLALIGKFRPDNRPEWAGICEVTRVWASKLPFMSGWDDQADGLNIVENNPIVWGKALKGES